MPDFDAEELKMVLLRVIAIVTEEHKSISRGHLTTFVISRNPLQDSVPIRSDAVQRGLARLSNEDEVAAVKRKGPSGLIEDYFSVSSDGEMIVRWTKKNRDAADRITLEAERAFRPHEREP